MKSSGLQERIIAKIKENASQHIWHLDLMDLTPGLDSSKPSDSYYNYKMLQHCVETMQPLIAPFFQAKAGFSRVVTCIVFEEVILPPPQNNNPDFVNDVCTQIVKSRADKLSKIENNILIFIQEGRYSYSNNMISLAILNNNKTDGLTTMEQKELQARLEAIGLSSVTCNSDVYDGRRPTNRYHYIEFKVTGPLKTDQGSSNAQAMATAINSIPKNQENPKSLGGLIELILLQQPQTGMSI